MTFDVTYNGSSPFVFDGSTHFGFTARTTIDRKAFGLMALLDMVSEEVEPALDLQFVRAALATESG